MIEKLAQQVVKLAKQKGVIIATAESCTGGMVSCAITSVSGSSEVFDRGFVTYSNESKIEMLGVDPQIIKVHGAVSQEVARAMVEGCIKNSNAKIAISITGIAGPTGGSAAKPVGTVFIAVKYLDQVKLTKNYFSGSRSKVREQSAIKALEQISEFLKI